MNRLFKYLISFSSLFILIQLSLLATDNNRFKVNQWEPELHSIIPIGGTVGSSLEVELRGKYLEGTYATWLGHNTFKAKLVLVEPTDLIPTEAQSKNLSTNDREYRLLINLTIPLDATPGPKPLRVISPRGVSNQVYFQIYKDPVISETQLPHYAPSQAQLINIPTVVNGVIKRQGELDYYSLDVETGQELAFEVIFSREALEKGFRPHLKLLEPARSWFSSEQAKQLAFNTGIRGTVTGEAGSGWRFIDSTPINSGLTYKFTKGKRYLIQVSSEGFKGNSDYIYQLRIVPVNLKYDQHLARSNWDERSYLRELNLKHLDALWNRTVTVNQPISFSQGAKSLTEQLKRESYYFANKILPSPLIARKVVKISEHEPNDEPIKALPVELPVIIEGVVDRPGDVDYFKFKINSTQRLAFEIETQNISPPHFNPRLEVRNSAGQSVLTNIHRLREFRNPDGWVLKGNEPKVIDTFDQPGEYSVEIRGVTSRSGNQACRYRLLIRPQIPHVGDIVVETLMRGHQDTRIDPMRINLEPGKAKVLNIKTQIEEIDDRSLDGRGERAFDWGAGEIAFSVEGLPTGVSTYTGAAILDVDGKGSYESLNRSNFLPDTQKSILVLRADPDAELTKIPQIIRIMVRPLIDGHLMKPLLAAELPLMIVTSRSKTIANK